MKKLWTLVVLSCLVLLTVPVLGYSMESVDLIAGQHYKAGKVEVWHEGNTGSHTEGGDK